MAKYGIFFENVCLKIATDENNRDYLMARIKYSVAKEITDEQFNAVGNDRMNLHLDDDGNILATSRTNSLSEAGGIETGVTDQAAFCQEIIDFQSSLLKSYMRSNQGQPDFDIWQDYQNKLNEVDVTTMTFPMEQTFQEWFNSQEGYPQKFILQLP